MKTTAAVTLLCLLPAAYGFSPPASNAYQSPSSGTLAKPGRLCAATAWPKRLQSFHPARASKVAMTLDSEMRNRRRDPVRRGVVHPFRHAFDLPAASEAVCGEVGSGMIWRDPFGAPAVANSPPTGSGTLRLEDSCSSEPKGPTSDRRRFTKVSLRQSMIMGSWKMKLALCEVILGYPSPKRAALLAAPSNRDVDGVKWLEYFLTQERFHNGSTSDYLSTSIEKSIRDVLLCTKSTQDSP